MISFSEYRDVLIGLREAGIQSRCIHSLHSDLPASGELYIKHDVEGRMGRAVRMARIEAQEGHQATYYFQGDLIRKTSAHQQLREISDLGHEVAYHYDVLDANEGDYARAIAEFAEYCRLFELRGNKVTTVCPHGNPTKLREGWNSNKDLFRSGQVRSNFPDLIDIVVDFDKFFPHGIYISDAGRSLRIICEIAENDKSNLTAMNDGKRASWSSLSQLVHANVGTVLSVHPHRFYENAFAEKLERVSFLVLKSAYLKLRKFSTIERLASRFYKVARRF